MLSEPCLQSHPMLQPMLPGDLEDVLAIEQASFPSPWTRNMFIEELSTPIARNFTLWTVPEESRVLVGYMIFWVVAREVHLQKIAIKPEYRRRDAASLLVKTLLESARQEQCRTVILEVRRSNTAARRLYEKFGFILKGVRRAYYEEGEDALIMGMDLPVSDGPMEV